MMFFDEDGGLPEGWSWMELPNAASRYRQLWSKLFPGLEAVFRPAVKD